MPILIKMGKIKAIEDISYATDYTVYKKYTCGNAPIVFVLSPLSVKEGKEYLCIIEFNEQNGEGRLITLCEAKKKTAFNEILGVLQVDVMYNKIKAGKFEVVIEGDIKDLTFPLRGSCRFRGKKIVFRKEERGNCILVKRGV